jgi:hypothetical protein
MITEVLLAQIALANQNGRDLFINAQNARNAGVSIAELRQQFFMQNGRVLLTNENIKVRFDQEGNHLDFSTFDNSSIRVDFDKQNVSPNKGGDDIKP